MRFRDRYPDLVPPPLCDAVLPLRLAGPLCACQLDATGRLYECEAHLRKRGRDVLVLQLAMDHARRNASVGGASALPRAARLEPADATGGTMLAHAQPTERGDLGQLPVASVAPRAA